MVVFDEFTSVVDRNVARVVSAAVAKGIRSGQIGCRFVAVTCHYDVTEWLAPDWVIDMATASFTRRRLRRPPIELEIFRCRRSAWRMFARHHYLSGALSQYARCFLALWEGVPVAFCAMVSLIGRKNRWRISRIVTLPDYQGIGIGMAVAEAVAELHVREGNRVNVTASHPSLIAHCRRSPRWRVVGVKKTGSRRSQKFIANYRGSTGRAVVSFEYVGDRDQRMQETSREHNAADRAARRRESRRRDAGHPQRGMQPEHGRQVRRLLAGDDPPRGRTRSEVRRETPPGEGQRRTGTGQEHPQRREEGAVLAGGGLGARTMFPEKYARRGPDVITAEQLAQILDAIRRADRRSRCPSTSIARTSSRTSSRWPAASAKRSSEEEAGR